MLVPQVVETKAARSCEQAKLQGLGVGLIACGKIE
jgi:hypothetical protein